MSSFKGPGQVTSDSLKDTIRTHHDIEKDNNNARFIKKSARVSIYFPLSILLMCRLSFSRTLRSRRQ